MHNFYFIFRLLECICRYVLYYFTKKIIMGNNRSTTSMYSFKTFNYEKVSASLHCSPLPRSGHRIVCDIKNLYSFGGYNPLILTSGNEEDDYFAVHSFPLFQELWKFNFASKRWKRYNSRHSLPQELASNAVIREGNYLMVYGGTGSPFGHRCSNQLYICNLNDEQGQMFEINTSGQLPIPQYGQALVYHNNYLYTIGGTTGFAYTCDVHRLHMNTRVWENVYTCQGQSDVEPEGRYRHEVAFDGKHVYVLGGGTADRAFDFNVIPMFNIETHQWQMPKAKRDIHGFPQARRCHGAVQVQTENDIHVFISGGYDGETVFDDLWRLELSTLQWTYIEWCVLPTPIYFHSTSISPEGKMYVFGGIYGSEDITRSNDIYMAWLRIPKLSEMCWEALLHYSPEIVNYPQEKLINIGLPRHFVQRLM